MIQQQSAISSRFSTPRDERIDLIRGFAVLVIYSYGVAGNTAAERLHKLCGPSDMAEAFVFISGYVCGISYSKCLARLGFISAQRKALRRCVDLYIAYVVTLVALALMGGALNRNVGLTEILWRNLAESPANFVMQVLTLEASADTLSILALYMLLLAALPSFLWMLSRAAPITVVLWISAYCAVQLLPQYTRVPEPWGPVFGLHPLAWQLLFFAGAIVATYRDRFAWLRPSRSILPGCCLILLVFLVASYRTQGELPLSGKSILEPFRVLHFVALLTVVATLLAQLPPRIESRPAQWLILCGRNTLITFCSGILLSAFATTALAHYAQSISAQIAVNVAGWLACIAIAGQWENAKRRFAARKRVEQTPQSSPASATGAVVNQVFSKESELPAVVDLLGHSGA